MEVLGAGKEMEKEREKRTRQRNGEHRREKGKRNAKD